MSGARRVVVVAALPREIQALVKGIAPDAVARQRGVLLYRLPEATVVAAGMGAARASLAVEAAFADGPPVLMLSVGLAGSCSPSLSPGAVVEAGQVVDVRTGERFGGGGPVLASTEQIASVAEKARLLAAYDAVLVDMEAAAVARLARANGIAFRSIKGISDAHDFELAGLSRFSSPQGKFRTAAFALHTALHPGTWSAAVQLGRNSSRALGALEHRIREAMAQAF